MKTIWESTSLIKPSEDILPYTCFNCNISDNDNKEDPLKTRLVPFPSYPFLRKKRILIVGEFPSYDSLTGKVPHPFYGPTIQVLLRAFKYLNLSEEDFSYTTLIRCWRNLTTKVTNENYDKCSQWLNSFIALSEAPLIITLGGTVANHIFKHNVLHNQTGKRYSLSELRRKWTSEPFQTNFEILGVPTEHPRAVKLIRCNTQPIFRSICVDIMRAVGYAANIVPEYNTIAKKMNISTYIEEFNNIVNKNGEKNK